MSASALPGPRVPVVDENGLINAAWYRYFVGLEKNASAAAAGEVVAGDGLEGGGAVASGVTVSVAPHGITDAMLREGLATSVIGRFQGSNGPVADIQATADNRVLIREAGQLVFRDIALVPATVADADYGDITVSGSGAVWTIDANVISNAKFRQSAGLSVVGRSANSTGNVADITGTANQFLGVNAAGTALAFQSGAALTKTDDTNVTLTLGGSASSALLAAASLTLGWSGQLSPARGGTGIASYAIGDLIYASGATTLSKLADVATGNVLISGGVTTAPSWGKVGLATHVSGTLGVGNGGTGVTSLGDITRTNDTNVTLTLGGTPTGAVITSTSFTLGWTGQLAVTRGGSGLSSATLGDLWYASAANTMSALAGNTTATKKWLNQTGTGTASVAPVWSTIAASDIASGAALTKTDDTNVTLTLGGSPTAALLAAASITAGWAGTLAVTRGGLGFGTTTQGDLIYADASNSLAKLAKNTSSTRYLSNTGTSNNPAWAQVDMTNGVTGLLPAANGGTGNGFTGFTGPATSTKTFTLPNASDTIACLGQAQTFTALQKVSVTYTDSLNPGGFRLTSNIPGVSLETTSANASSRNFAILAQYNGFQTMDFNVSSTQGGNPDTTMLTLTPSSAHFFGSTFRIDQTPTSLVQTATHYVTMNFNGTDYKVLLHS